MEIKARLQKPYTESERINFIVEQNHKSGYEINETETELQALGCTQEEIEEQTKQVEQERKSKLRMTKRDFFLYVIQPFGVTYSALMQVLKSNDTVWGCYDGCSYIYRYDTMLVGNIKPMLETLTEQEIDEEGLNSRLDLIFEEHCAKD